MDHESLYSFLHRLAIVNHYEHFGSMFKEYKMSSYDDNCNEIHADLFWVSFITDLLYQMKIDIQPLIVNQYDDLLVRKNMESSYRRISYRKYYHRYSTKFCPECLKEDFFHRIYWDVSYVTTCVQHNIDLISNCTTCGEYVRMSRLMRDSCMCGAGYTTMIAKNTDPITSEVQNVFQEFLLGKRKKIVRADYNILSSEEYLEFFYFFSLLIHGLDSNKFFFSSLYQFEQNFYMIAPSITKINTDKSNLIVNTAHFLTLDPSKDLITLVDMVSELGRGLAYSMVLKSKKTKIFNNLFKQPKGRYYHEIYTDYLNNKKDEYINQRIALPPLELRRKKYLTFFEATSLLNSQINTTKNLCHHGILKLHETYKNGRKISLIERKSVDEYIKMKLNCFSFLQATEYLELTFRHMMALIELKRINPLHGPSIDGYERWYIKKKEILRFQKLLYSKFLPLSSVKGKRGITIKEACFKLRLAQVNIEGVYKYILDDRLRVYQDEKARSIDKIKILDEDVKQLAKELYYKKIIQKGYFGKQIQRACKTDQKTIKRLLEDDILRVNIIETYGKHTPVKFIQKQQIIEYLNKYKGMSKQEIKKHLTTVEVFFEPKD
nr:TniQ family protein [uncultured Psychrobacillus sp.]